MSKQNRVAAFVAIIVAGCLLDACNSGSGGGVRGTGGGHATGGLLGSGAGYGGGSSSGGSGGATETGGTIGSGGRPSTGGMTPSGGSANTGTTTTGGSTVGGSTVGGSTNTGGQASSGGTTATGGGDSRLDAGADSAAGGSDAANSVGAGRTGAARTITNIYFAGTSSASQALDLLLPANARIPLPLVIRFHGGGFSGGKKEPEESGTAAQAILARGYALASVNYRLSGDAPFPAGVKDAKAAARWLRAHAAEYGLDTARFASWGESAGAYLAVALGATGDQATAFDDDTLGNPGVSSAVAAVIDWYGPIDLATMDSQQAAHPPMSCSSTWLQHTPASSPEGLWLGAALDAAAVSTKLLQANLSAYLATAKILPTFFIAHGDNDCQVPWGQSQELTDALAKAGNTASLTILPGASHADARFESTQTTPALTLLGTVFGR